MSRRHVWIAVILAAVLILAFAAPALAKKGPPVAESTNNLSFPAIAADGYGINAITVTNPTLTYPYIDPATGLPLILNGYQWYAQKVVGNTWQAKYELAGTDTVGVYGVDWGDNIESVNPYVRRPYRLELVLFDLAADWSATSPGGPEGNAFEMALLANPSSPDEVQGTNGVRYDSAYATVVSSKPGLVIQNITDYLDADDPVLTWDADLARWVSGTAVPDPTPIGFGPELNVAGKYIFGGSTGGWKPTSAGTYRVTFYVPADSSISLAGAGLGSLADGAWTWLDPPITTAEEGDEETPKATPVLDRVDNLTYVDLTVMPRR